MKIVRADQTILRDLKEILERWLNDNCQAQPQLKSTQLQLKLRLRLA